MATEKGWAGGYRPPKVNFIGSGGGGGGVGVGVGGGVGVGAGVGSAQAPKSGLIMSISPIRMQINKIAFFILHYLLYANFYQATYMLKLIGTTS